MIWLSPRQSRGKIAAATTLASPLSGISPLRRDADSAALKQFAGRVNYLTSADMVVTHPLGVQ
jgi:hypothetical protein